MIDTLHDTKPVRSSEQLDGSRIAASRLLRGSSAVQS